MNSSIVSKPKPTPKLVLIAIITSSFTIATSLIYIALCIVALVYRCNTEDPSSVPGSRFFLNTVYRAYLQNEECSPNAITMDGITAEYSVFVLVTITLSASFVSLVAAIILISAVTFGVIQYLSMIVYGYIGVYVASLAVDLTFAAHFGMDYTYLTNLLDNSSPGLGLNYERDVIRIGAFVLMTVTLKAFIGHLINIFLMALLVVCFVEHSQIQHKQEHSIHKLGALKAYDTRRDRDPNQQLHVREPYQPTKGSQINHGYMNDEEPPRSPMRENYRSDFPGNGFDRSNSWQPGPGSTGRPFSYLEEAKRPIPVRPPSSPAVESSWRDPWRSNAPPLPAPDYSPTTPRRLKSALKSGYM